MKKQYIFLAVLLILIAGLSVLALTKYEHSPKGMTTSQAVKQRNDALVDLKIQKGINDVKEESIINLEVRVDQLSSEKATLCTQIKTAKLPQPLCP